MCRMHPLWSANFEPADGSPYFVKHNPFASFASIVRSQERWLHIDNEAGLFADLLNGNLPEYAWITPNIWNDGHWIDGTKDGFQTARSGPVDQLARWLEVLFARLRFSGSRFALAAAHAGGCYV